MSSCLQTRRDRYCEQGNRLAHMDNRQLNSLLGERGPTQGWGRTHVIRLGSSKVFVKRIPVTDLEFDHPYSTENLYRLPTFYNYGVGSAGFVAFRELVAHVKTTNWVLDGQIENFPLMYHYRIVPSLGTPPDLDEERHQGYVNYWNGDENIDRYIRDRNSARHEAVIFLEHFPHVLHSWLAKNGNGWKMVIREMQPTIDFMRCKGMIHFDSHFGNILIDNGRPCLTDFGLALDRNFNLNDRERAFYSRHTDYDYAEFFSCMGSHLFSLYHGLSARNKKKVTRRYGVEDDAGYSKLLPILLENLEEIHVAGWIELDDEYVSHILRQRSLILLMNEFYSRLRDNPKKDTPYPSTTIWRRLKEAAVL